MELVEMQKTEKEDDITTKNIENIMIKTLNLLENEWKYLKGVLLLNTIEVVKNLIFFNCFDWT